MTTEQEKHFALLLSEAQYCNVQIGNFLELQLKILGVVVSAVGVSLGLLFAAQKQGPGSSLVALSEPAVAKILVALSVVMTFAVIQGCISYSIALGYIRYKSCELAPQLEDLLALAETPLASARSIFRGPSGLPLIVSSGVATVGFFASNLAMLNHAWQLAPAAGPGTIRHMVEGAGIARGEKGRVDRSKGWRTHSCSLHIVLRQCNNVPALRSCYEERQVQLVSS